MHSTNNLDDGYLGSGKRLWYSLNKHGRENHKIERLLFFETREELKNKEIEIVNEELLKNPLCMNIQLGGNDGRDVCWSINSNSTMQREKSIKGNDRLSWLHENDKEWEKKWKKNVSEGVKKARKKHDWWKDRKHSESTIKNMKISHKNKHPENKNFRWVFNNKEIKRIKVEELHFYLENGWLQGRKKL
jgi:Straboviridae putative endonuclease SegB